MYAFHAAALLPGDGSTSCSVTALPPILAIGLLQVLAIRELIMAVVMAPLGGPVSPRDLEVTGAPRYGQDAFTQEAPKGDLAMSVFHHPSAAAGTKAVLNVHLQGSCQTHEPAVAPAPSAEKMIRRTRSGTSPLMMGWPSAVCASVTGRPAQSSVNPSVSLARTRPLHWCVSTRSPAPCAAHGRAMETRRVCAASCTSDARSST